MPIHDGLIPYERPWRAWRSRKDWENSNNWTSVCWEGDLFVNTIEILRIMIYFFFQFYNKFKILIQQRQNIMMKFLAVIIQIATLLNYFFSLIDIISTKK